MSGFLDHVTIWKFNRKPMIIFHSRTTAHPLRAKKIKYRMGQEIDNETAKLSMEAFNSDMIIKPRGGKRRAQQSWSLLTLDTNDYKFTQENLEKYIDFPEVCTFYKGLKFFITGFIAKDFNKFTVTINEIVKIGAFTSTLILPSKDVKFIEPLNNNLYKFIEDSGKVAYKDLHLLPLNSVDETHDNWNNAIRSVLLQKWENCPEHFKSILLLNIVYYYQKNYEKRLKTTVSSNKGCSTMEQVKFIYYTVIIDSLVKQILWGIPKQKLPTQLQSLQDHVLVITDTSGNKFKMINLMLLISNFINVEHHIFKCIITMKITNILNNLGMNSLLIFHIIEYRLIKIISKYLKAKVNYNIGHLSAISSHLLNFSSQGYITFGKPFIENLWGKYSELLMYFYNFNLNVSNQLRLQFIDNDLGDQIKARF